ncbi:LON peptidase substrate-binding domain-containing protein [Algoriphagus sp. H41]|uniref:LON peptidase substrate-binding domain-containing protein n=1 Tax=Algoriphagus oliviformis TaxID=2811231 RepID=A0ABS3C592_9BACT|nr:LON peptidase substrate-binding domain-containing protein [Algoriphagus oliviformis]MBN7811754.1 LON peptidase substrate-binding domain-containing protein [Algoriphagus oliviformis]
MYLPFFPLKLVAFPGEELNLHIFEPRYKELLSDIEQSGGTFGICVYLDKLSSFGTEVALEKINKRYDDGRLDIRPRGLRAFRILSFDNPMKDKLYAGGTVSFLGDDPKIPDFLHHEFVFYLKEMLRLLNFQGEFDPGKANSYTFAHKLGLKLEEELELLQMGSESARTEFLIRHFKRMIPVIKAVEQAREKIKLNGHFKHLDPLNF